MSYENLKIEKNEKVAALILNRPDCGNALSLSLMREIIEAANSFKYDTAVSYTHLTLPTKRIV